jgi:hypothetical protein
MSLIALMTEAACTSETSVDIQLRTRQYIQEDSELRNCECFHSSLYLSLWQWSIAVTLHLGIGYQEGMLHLNLRLRIWRGPTTCFARGYLNCAVRAMKWVANVRITEFYIELLTWMTLKDVSEGWGFTVTSKKMGIPYSAIKLATWLQVMLPFHLSEMRGQPPTFLIMRSRGCRPRCSLVTVLAQISKQRQKS